MNRLTPFYHHSGDPLFDVETRRALWSDARTLTRRTLVWAIVMCAAGFALFVIMWQVMLLRQPSVSSYYTMASFYIIFSMTLVSLWLDMACLRTSIRAINSEILSGRWDLLRLTPIRIQAILNAKHAAAQVRAWRTLAQVIGLRAALLPIMILWVIFSLDYFITPTGTPALFRAQYIISLAYALVFTVMLMLEPVWRMRAMTALGVAVSAQTRDQTGAWLLGLAGVFVVWLGQLAVLVGVVIGWGLFSFMFALGSVWLSVLCLAPAGLAILSLAAYGYYLVVRTWALRRAARRLANLES